MSLHERIHDLHRPPLLPQRLDWQHQRILAPHIGEHFESRAPGCLRVMALGINSYVEPHQETHPGWFATWFQKQEHRFFPAVARELRSLTTALGSLGAFPGLTFDGEAPSFQSVYLTNAVRRYLPEDIGAKAHTVPAAFFDEGAEMLGAELDMLHDHGALPHVVVIFGGAFWSRAWRAFGAQPRPTWVADYRPRARTSDLFHRLNVVEVLESGSTRPLLLVRLTHPAAPTMQWRAAELSAHPDLAATVHELFGT